MADPRLNAANQAETTIASSVSNSDTTIDVVNASVFPSAPFRATIYDSASDEIVEVTSVDTGNDVLTVTRGMEDTAAQSWDSDVSIEQRFTAGTYDELSDGFSVSDDGSVTLQDVEDVNFTDSGAATVNASDDGDGTVTINVDSTDTDTDTRVDVSKDNTVVLSEPQEINFTDDGATSVTVNDGGGGQVNVDISSTDTDSDTRTDVSDDGTTVVSNVSDINFTSSGAATANVTDDGDGSVTVAVSASDNDTTYSAGDGLALSSTTFSVDVSDFAGSGLQDDGSENLQLVNNSVTVAGNSVSLGGSTSVAFEDLSNVALPNATSAGQIPVYDGVDSQFENASLTGGNNVTVTNGDASVTIDATDTDTTYSAGSGLSLSGTTFSASLDFEDGGTDVITGHGVNFGSNLSVTDDGDGTVTVDASSSGGGHSVSDSGTEVLASIDDVNFGSNLSVTDDGDSTVTVDASSSGGSPGGSDTQLQFNDAGSFGGTSGLTWDSSNSRVDFSGEVNIGGGGGVSIGGNNTSERGSPILVGNGASQTALGSGLSGDRPVAIGDNSSVESQGAAESPIAIGGNASAVYNAIGIGSNTAVSQGNSIFIGNNSSPYQYSDPMYVIGENLTSLNLTGNGAGFFRVGMNGVGTGDITGVHVEFNTNAGNWVRVFDANEGNLTGDGNVITDVADPSNAQEAATKNYVDTNTGGGSSGETFSFSTGMTEWSDALSNEEIERLVLQSGEALEVERIEVRQKGGGTSTSFSARVQDITAASTVGSQNLGGTTKDPGTTGTANTALVQVTNTTGGTITASIRVVGTITGA